MAALPRFAIDLLQAAGSTRLLGPLGSAAFLATAKQAALDFARLRGVRSVYLTGSWTRPGAAAPGYSDIDLVLVVEVPTLEAELRLRRDLRETQARWNTFAKLLKHLDYVERQDLELVLRGGNVFWVDAHNRFEALAGISDLTPGIEVHRHKPLERTISALKRWLRVSHVLIDPTFVRDERITRRASERLLAGVIADCLLLNPNEPTATLIERGCEGIPGMHAFRSPKGTSARAYALQHTAAALQVVEHVCRNFTHGFPPVAQSPERPSYEPDAFDRSARQLGFAGGAIVELPPPFDPALAFILSNDDPETSVDRLHRGSPTLETPTLASGPLRPALLTRAMWPVSRLLYPLPFTGEAFAARGSAWGAPPPLSEATRRMLVTGRMLDLFYRPRGRIFRVERTPEVALRGLALDVHRVVPMLLAYRAGIPMGTPPPMPERLDEARLLDELRTFVAGERPAMAASLGVSHAAAIG